MTRGIETNGHKHMGRYNGVIRLLVDGAVVKEISATRVVYKRNRTEQNYVQYKDVLMPVSFNAVNFVLTLEVFTPAAQS